VGGKTAVRNPWMSHGFEWFTLTPVPTENFLEDIGILGPPHDYRDDHPEVVVLNG
jgi:hypothetical protein